MIQPHEIQRFYLYDYCNNVVEVIELFRDGLCTIKNFKTGVRYTNVNQSDLAAIPLSEKILTDWCGFEQENGMMSYELNGIKIVYETLANFYRFYPRTNKILYLHQLQLLYLALTNQPLKIELK